MRESRRKSPGIPSRWLHGPGPLLVGLAACLMFVWSYGTWPDVLVDFGKELYLSWQLSEGKTLYRDIAHYSGPLSAYFNAQWFRLFGASLRTLVLANSLVLAVLVASLYWILREISTRLAATVGCVVFVTVFAFSQYTQNASYNYLCPYSHELTHGALLAIVALVFLGRYERTRSPSDAGGSGLALGLAFLTKPEVFVAAAAAVGCGLAFLGWQDGGARRRLPLALGVLSGAATAPVLVAVGLLGLAMPLERALAGTLRSWTMVWRGEVPGLTFYEQGMGVDRPAENLAALAWEIAAYLAVFVPVGAVALGMRRPGPARPLISALIGLAVGGGLALGRRQIPWPNAARPLPALILMMGVAWLVLARGRGPGTNDSGRPALRIAMLAFGLALLSKMILNVRIYHYGFVLAAPAALLLVAALVAWVPDLLDGYGGYGAAFRVAAMAVVAVVVGVHLEYFGAVLKRKSVVVGSGPDSFLADWRGILAEDVLAKLREALAPGASLAALPEGAMLNYLGRWPNPTPYNAVTPTEVVLYGEGPILEAYRAHPPDYVVLVHKDTSEFGYRYFGQDYAQRLGLWIEREYQPVYLAGEPPLRDERFGILVLRRRTLPAVGSPGMARDDR